MPAASAITFLSAPANSTPSTSVAEYTRKKAVEKTCCTRWATAWSRAAATTAVGWCVYTSCANDGPDSTATGVPCGSTSPSTQDSVPSRSGSSPLDTLTTRAPRPRWAPARVMTSRTACEGPAETTTSASRTAVATSACAVRVAARGAPGRNMWFTCSRFTLSTTSGSRAHSVTAAHSPLRASRSASAVPQAPPPMTATRVTPPPQPSADCGLRIAECANGPRGCESAIRNPQSAIDGSRSHALSRTKPILRALPQPPDVRPVRVHQQQRQYDRRPERVGLARRGETHPQGEQHGDRQRPNRDVP